MSTVVPIADLADVSAVHAVVVAAAVHAVAADAHYVVIKHSIYST